MFRRVKMMRQWGGITDNTADRSPIQSVTPVPNLFVNAGWGTGGFKATPGSANLFAHLIAKGEPHRLAQGLTLDRFRTAASSTRQPPLPWRTDFRDHSSCWSSNAPIAKKSVQSSSFAPPVKRISRAGKHRFDHGRGVRRLLLPARQPEGPDLRALAPYPWLRALLQCRPRHDLDKILLTYKAGEPMPDPATLVAPSASKGEKA